MTEMDSFSLFSSVKAVRELLQRKLQDGGAQATGELEAGLEEIEALWHELRTRSDELASERQRYTEFFDYAPDAYLVTDDHGTVREANRAAAELLGVAARSIVGKPLLSFIAERSRTHFRAELQRAAAQSDAEVSAWRGTLSLRSGQQVSVDFRVRAMPVPDGGLPPLCWLVRPAG
jgi:PAS domain S-box-containing protein